MKKELCVKLVIYKDYIEMYGQQNITFYSSLLLSPEADWSVKEHGIVHCNGTGFES
jgi:hypothetical protein